MNFELDRQVQLVLGGLDAQHCTKALPWEYREYEGSSPVWRAEEAPGDGILYSRWFRAHSADVNNAFAAAKQFQKNGGNYHRFKYGLECSGITMYTIFLDEMAAEKICRAILFAATGEKW